MLGSMAIRSHISNFNLGLTQPTVVFTPADCLLFCVSAHVHFAVARLVNSFHIAFHFAKIHVYIDTVSIGYCRFSILFRPLLVLLPSFCRPFPSFCHPFPSFSAFAMLALSTDRHIVFRTKTFLAIKSLQNDYARFEKGRVQVIASPQRISCQS